MAEKITTRSGFARGSKSIQVFDKARINNPNSSTPRAATSKPKTVIKHQEHAKQIHPIDTPLKTVNTKLKLAEERKSLGFTVINETFQGLLVRLHEFEEKYGMSTVQFYAQFMAGKMGDSRDFIKWAAFFRQYQKLLEATFQPLTQAA
jgi:uncharacterized protein YchJ